MPRLILLNGPPAAGKSTLARRYTADHPLALCLDVDVVRSLLGGWLERPDAAGTAARALALVMAREHLLAGHDVVVPQFLARPRLPEQLESLGHQVGADFVEVVLDVDPHVMLERFTQRTAENRRGEHRDAADLLERSGGLAALAQMRAEMLALITDRPRARCLTSHSGDVEETYRDLLAVITAAAVSS